MMDVEFNCPKLSYFKEDEVGLNAKDIFDLSKCWIVIIHS